jgi:hypothetical protein
MTRYLINLCYKFSRKCLEIRPLVRNDGSILPKAIFASRGSKSMRRSARRGLACPPARSWTRGFPRARERRPRSREDRWNWTPSRRAIRAGSAGSSRRSSPGSTTRASIPRMRTGWSTSSEGSIWARGMWKRRSGDRGVGSLERQG